MMRHRYDEIILELTGSEPAVLRAMNEPTLAVNLLEKAKYRFSSSADTQNAIGEIFEIYCDRIRDGFAPWKEPELFWTLTQLNIANNPASANGLLALARFHIDPRQPIPCSDGPLFVRSPVLRGELFRRGSNGYDPYLENVISISRGVLVVSFCPGLYSDLLDLSLYPEATTSAEIQRFGFVGVALNRISLYSLELFKDISETVSLVALTDNISRPSFSCRTTYYGGIFANPYHSNGFQLAESIIHEFLHQRLWLWWEIEPLSNNECLSRNIISPVTGQTRSVEIMLQAALIYRECLDFYIWIHSSVSMEDAEEIWVSARISHLERSMSLLCNALRKEVNGEPKLVKYLEILQKH